MSKKESTNDIIVRMYKEGHSIEAIAEELNMPKGNVPNILEKYMPDYQNYVAPAIPQEKHKKKGGFGDLFKKNKPAKNTPAPAASPAEEAAAEPVKEEPKPKQKSHSKQQQVTVNLAMNEDGFIDGTVKGIAQMLRQGRDVETIVSIFNRSEADVNAVRECMNEHFRRQDEAEKVAAQNVVQQPQAPETSSTPKRPRYRAPEEKEEELSDEMPSIDPVSLDELDKQMEAMGGKPVEYDEPKKSSDMEPVSIFDEEENKPEQVQSEAESQADGESAEVADETPVGTVSQPEVTFTPFTITTEDKPAEEDEDLSFKPATEETSEEDTEFSSDVPETVAAIADTISVNTESYDTDSSDEEELSFTLDEEDESMSPMEKMKKFAEQQIALNNKKIEELKAKKEEILGSASDYDNELAENEESLSGVQSKARANEDEMLSAKTRLEELEKEIEEQKAKISDLENEAAEIAKETEEIMAKSEEIKTQKSEIQSKADEVDNEIAEVEKENQEFASYC